MMATSSFISRPLRFASLVLTDVLIALLPRSFGINGVLPRPYAGGPAVNRRLRMRWPPASAPGQRAPVPPVRLGRLAQGGERPQVSGTQGGRAGAQVRAELGYGGRPGEHDGGPRLVQGGGQ